MRGLVEAGLVGVSASSSAASSLSDAGSFSTSASASSKNRSSCGMLYFSAEAHQAAITENRRGSRRALALEPGRNHSGVVRGPLTVTERFGWSVELAELFEEVGV